MEGLQICLINKTRDCLHLQLGNYKTIQFASRKKKKNENTKGKKVIIDPTVILYYFLFCGCVTGIQKCEKNYLPNSDIVTEKGLKRKNFLDETC